MPVLLALAVLGGFIFLTRRTARSDALDVRSDFFDSRLDHFAAVGGTEKFADPIYDCVGRGASPDALDAGALPPSTPYTVAPNRAGIPTTIGYEYLADASRTSTARVAAMRGKISAAGKLRPVTALDRPASFLEALAIASTSKVRGIVDDLVARLSGSVDQVASTFGVSRDQAEAYQAAAASIVTESDAFRSLDRAAKVIAPVGQALVLAVDAFAGTAAASDKAIGLGLGAVSMATMQWAPVVGQVYALGLELAEGALSQIAAGREGMCAAQLDVISRTRDAALAIKMPIPWHAEDTFPPACPEYGRYEAAAWRPTREQLALEQLYRRNYWIASGTLATAPTSTTEFRDAGNGLAPLDRAHVARWWGLAQTLMGDVRVREVFAALGRDAFGGIVASDEQVMLVAAPYAVAYGFDVDEFARALWSRSRGWRDADPLSVTTRTLGSISYHGTDDGPVADVVRLCDGVVSDAWWVQWAVLSRDADALAREWRAAGKTSSSTSTIPLAGSAVRVATGVRL